MIFLDITGGVRELGAAPLDGDGFAVLRVSVRSGGHEFRALYLGDGTHAAELSAPLSLNVDADLADADALPLFTIGASL